MTEKKLIIANWKMNPQTEKEAKQLFSAYKRVAGTLRSVQTVIAPPFPYVSALSQMVTGHRCVLGGQDVFWEREGAFTGEVSPGQLAQYKLEYVIIGHSERRALGETSLQVSQKLSAAIAAGLHPVLCVGEKDRTGNDYFKSVKEQLRASLENIPKPALSKICIAYEPIWAISSSGTGIVATPEDAQEMAVYIKRSLAEQYHLTEHDTNVTILYGGSVDEKNVAGFLKENDVDGVLVGSASLKRDVFTTLLTEADGV